MVTRINRSMSTAQYEPSVPPNDPAQLQRYLTGEFQKIAAAVALLQAGHKDLSYEAPLKPRLGDERICDGVLWNPVATGVPTQVWYNGTAWQRW